MLVNLKYLNSNTILRNTQAKTTELSTQAKPLTT